MNRPQLTVLGGSSPFTASLIDSLREHASRLPAMKLVLQGRTQRNLDLVARYATVHLGPFGWSNETFNEMSRALQGTDFVINQIRYGGLELRGLGEKICQKLGVAADETLGPSALVSAISIVEPIRDTCHAIKRCCPDAWVLNLTNPLSCVTALMQRWGVKRCVGLCELPQFTFEKAACVLDLPASELSWKYVGLNHRGFIVELRHNGTDLLSKIPETLEKSGNATLDGTSAETIRQLSAIPLKYFRLLTGDTKGQAGRAEALSSLRDRVLDELAQSPSESPPSLGERYLEWYAKSVVPLIVGLCSADTATHVVNYAHNQGVIEEGFAKVGNHIIEPYEPVSVSIVAVQRWLERFKRHERAFVKATLDPSSNNIRDVFSADPIVPDNHVEQAATLIADSTRHLGENSTSH